MAQEQAPLVSMAVWIPSAWQPRSTASAKSGLQGHLAAGEGHAAARVVEERLHAHGPLDHLPGGDARSP